MSFSILHFLDTPTNTFILQLLAPKQFTKFNQEAAVFTRPSIWSKLEARSRSYGSPATETRTSRSDRYLSRSNRWSSPFSRRARHGIPYLAQPKKSSSCYPETATSTSLQHSSKVVIGPSMTSTTSCTTSSRRQAQWSAPTYVV